MYVEDYYSGETLEYTLFHRIKYFSKGNLLLLYKKILAKR